MEGEDGVVGEGAGCDGAKSERVGSPVADVRNEAPGMLGCDCTVDIDGGVAARLLVETETAGEGLLLPSPLPSGLMPDLI